MRKISIWLSKRYRRIINSIAFLPIVIALCFIALSYFLIRLDYSGTGKEIKAGLDWLRLKDASTARSILTAIVSGIISLSVFSFSNVMVVLNQTASQMSNRILNNLIGNRFQQLVLGVYIGTIIFALALLSVIRDIDSGVYVPAISIYLLILLTIIDIFLFIYFLHFITQSVKYEIIIQKIYEETRAAMNTVCMLPEEALIDDKGWTNIITAGRSGIYEGFNKNALLKVCSDNDCEVQILHAPGTFLLDDSLLFSTSKSLPDGALKDARDAMDITNSEDIKSNFLYGFRQLTEVAVRALGNQDSGTTVESIQALSKLFSFRLRHHPDNEIKDKEGRTLIFNHHLSLEDTFCHSILSIWDYGKTDRAVLHALKQLLSVVCRSATVPSASKLAKAVDEALEKMKL